MSFFRSNAHFITSVGTGLVLGIVYWRLANRIISELQRLSGTLVQLRAEIDTIKEVVENSRRRRRPGSGFITASSGDDDEDVYEEAYGGSDLELLTELEERASTPYKEPHEAAEPVSKEVIFQEVDKLLEGPDEDKQKAYDILQNNRHLFLTDVDYHWRLSKTTFQLSKIEGAKGHDLKKKEYVYTAKDLAQAALGLDDQCANAHKWFAITIGSIGEFEGTQEKIKNGFKYKEHIEKAIALNPTDPSNHYLLGRWCYSVYMLSWLERKAAATLFATPPTATIEETLTHFLRADELNPGKWKENMLFIAKSYIELRQYKEATQWLTKAKQTPVISQDDRTAQAEVESLLTKYQGY